MEPEAGGWQTSGMPKNQPKMGRPPLPAGEQRAHRLVILLTDTERDELVFCSGRGERLATAARRLLLERVRGVPAAQ